MQLRSGRRLVYPPPEPLGAGHHRSQHSSEDRISSLPKDLLLEVLARLRSTAEAARDGAVCPALRGIWTDLPELRFSDTDPYHVVESALARITRPSLDLLDVKLWVDDEEWTGEQVSSLLHDAARVFPEKLIVTVMSWPLIDYAVDLPCFERTSHLSLGVSVTGSLPITLPRHGEFTALKSLHLESCCIDLGALLPLCPCLRILDIKNLDSDTVDVHSPSLEEFSLKVYSYEISCVDIVAPVLKEVTLDVDIAKGFSLSFSAPMVKKLRWGYYFPCACVGFGQIWHLIRIKEHEVDDFHVVSLELTNSTNVGLVDTEWSIAQVIAHLPVTVYSVLEIDLKTKVWHAFGPLMWRLLQIQPTIQRLKVVLARDKQVLCPVNCPCEQPSNWRSEDVSLAYLEVVEIHGLNGKDDDEVDFLKTILRCATVLRRLTMTISHDISPSNNGYEKICNIMKEYPYVQYHVMASGSEEVLYP